jgi:hypothetical protein
MPQPTRLPLATFLTCSTFDTSVERGRTLDDYVSLTGVALPIPVSIREENLPQRSRGADACNVIRAERSLDSEGAAGACASVKGIKSNRNRKRHTSHCGCFTPPTLPIKEKVSSHDRLARLPNLGSEDREILACNGGPNHAIRQEWTSTLVPSADPGRESDGTSQALKENNSLENTLFRILWSS